MHPLKKLLVSVSCFALTWSAGGVHHFTSNAFALASPPEQSESQLDAFSDLVPLNDQALERQRGGFKVGNYDINVGVTVTTTVNGFATVTTNISVEMPQEIKDLPNTISNIANEAVESANAAVAAAKSTANVALDTAAISVAAAATPPETEASATVPIASPDHGQVNGAPVETLAVTPSPAIPQPADQPTNITGNAVPVINVPAVAEPMNAVASPQNNLNVDAASAGAMPDTPPQAMPQLADQSIYNAGNATTTIETPPVSDTINVLAEAQDSLNAAMNTAAEAVHDTGKMTASLSPTDTGGSVNIVHPSTNSATAAPNSPAADTPSPLFNETIAVEEPTPTAPSIASAPITATPSPAIGAEPEKADTPKPETPVIVAAQTVAAAVPANANNVLTQIIHQTNENGHVSVIMNNLDGVLIQQSVSFNLSVDNFYRVQDMVSLQRNISAISRQVGLMGLRH